MNDEIKEILDDIKDILSNKEVYDVEIDKEVLSLLLNYITNLQQENKKISKQHLSTINKLIETQQENERLKEQLEYLRSGEYLNQVKWERDLNENLNQTLGTELEDYKLRCEKAIKIIKKEKEIMGYAKYDSCLLLIENILQVEQWGELDER